MYPSEHRYTKDHEWVRVEDDVCVIGITDFAQKELGEVVYVEMPEIGHMFDAHDEMGTIESVKAVAEVYTPVAGEVIEVNDNLKDDPAAINDDPHGDGWLVKVKYSASTDFEDLMDAEEYEAFLQEGK
ncbi:MAG: glycine cleavage system protein GcvH [Acidobacteria bacterium]|nr:glycine cleavage system protein GcvH [Acidobacteriota bacterium]